MIKQRKKAATNRTRKSTGTHARGRAKSAASGKGLGGKLAGRSGRSSVSRRGKSAGAKSIVTTISARVDVGFGNALFIRGEGGGLSWDRGTPLQCIDPAAWVWSTNRAEDRMVFKLLLNDRVWSQGDDVSVQAGKSVELVPVF